MKPSLAVVAEVAVLAALLGSSALVPTGALFGLYVVVAELLATYLVHCPAHYIIGSLVGIRFRRAKFGRTTLAKALPQSLSSFAKRLPVLTLSTDRTTRVHASKRRQALMYASGTVASVSAALIVAAAATLVEPLLYSAVAWAVALGYLLFDLVFSPKTGDLARAKAALA